MWSIAAVALMACTAGATSVAFRSVTPRATSSVGTSLVTDIEERKQAEERLRRSEAFLTEAQHLSRTGSFGCNVASGEMFWSEETFRIFAYDRSHHACARCDCAACAS